MAATEPGAAPFSDRAKPFAFPPESLFAIARNPQLLNCGA
jgi:hypothetical protein